ncbi:MAG: EAL domain-containing protein [Leptospiraceae bacterium]|nr:EAL domain-containing protein [Leptospiraceae bacterium]
MQALVKALDNESLFIALQPQIDLQSGKVVGAEALARWIDTDGKFVSPGDFIPLAETTGLILRLGDQILRQTISAVKTLSKAGYKNLRIGFNTSMVQLTEPGFLERLERRIKEAGIQPGQLELEVTESVAMTRFDLIVELLQKVRAMGLAVAIDDFGTGFSSLAYLRRLPADRLKIDRAFVNEITGDNGGLSIAENIIELAQKLNLKTIAEGVETEAQGRWLRDHGCQEVQGFFYAKPMPLNELMDFLGR